jgi:hypothetical protein
MRLKISSLTVCILVLAYVVAAQECPKITFNRALWHPEQNLISASLMKPFHPWQNVNAKWLLFDSTGDVPVPLEPTNSQNYGDPDRPTAPPPDPSSSVVVRPRQPLLINHSYYLRGQNVTPVDCNQPQAEIPFTSVVTQRAKIPPFATSPSTSRDDSDFYIAPTIDGSTGTAASYTIDAKVQFRKGFVAPTPGFRSPGLSVIPGVDVKVSSNPKLDGNSVTFQVPLEVLTLIPGDSTGIRRLIPAIISRPGFISEADKKWHDINAVFGDSEYFILHGFGSDTFRVVTEPSIGFETGSNLKAQQAGTYPDPILRGNFGMRAVLTVFQPSIAKPIFSIESNYIRRLLLNPEPVFKQDTKGNLVFSSVGTNPRDHVDVKLTYNITQYVGASISYEYGQLPPVFTKVNNKYTFGITFKGQLQYKPANTTK